MNSVNLIGRLTQDPELRSTTGGTSVASLRIAINRPRIDGKDRGADFINVTAWNGTAEAVARYLTKGSRVAIEGRLEHQEWETEDGGRRQAVQVVARGVQFLDSKREEEPSQD